MVDVVQLVRASDCGSECRGFEPHPPPLKRKSWKQELRFSFVLLLLNINLRAVDFDRKAVVFWYIQRRVG